MSERDPRESVIRRCARAKVTLALDVQPAAGATWHAVDIVLQRIGLADRVEICTGGAPGSPRVSVSGADLSADTLATRALELVEQWLGLRLDVRVALAKRVPLGAGLGGGSADAAAILGWAADRWPAIRPELPALAAQVGSDVVFCASPWARCRATGRGEQLLPIDGAAALWVAVAHPGFALATSDVYAAFDRVGTTEPPRAGAVVDALRRGMVPSQVGNQLEEAAVAVKPEVADFRARLLRHAPRARTAMTGSGSAFVAVCADEREAAAVGRAWRADGVPFVWWGEASANDARDAEHAECAEAGSHRAGGPAD